MQNNRVWNLSHKGLATSLADQAAVSSATPAGVGEKLESPWGPGKRLLNDRFELEEHLGAGATGVVYRASDLEAARLQDANSQVALKILSSKVRAFPNAQLTLQRELEPARRLSHANIARLYKFYQDGDIWFVTMEFLQGRPWSEILRQHADSGMAFEEAASLLQQLFDGLSYAHSRHVLHRNLKPENLLLTANGVVKILDFASAAAMLGTLSPAYASPEMWQGIEADRRDDIYGAGCVAYELLSGRHPFDRATAFDALENQLPFRPVKGLTEAQNSALRHALQLRRSDRTNSIEELSRELLASGGSRSRRRYLRILRFGAAAIVIATSLWLLRPLIQKEVKVHPANVRGDAISGGRANQLARFLGANPDLFRVEDIYSQQQVESALESMPRRVTLGSSAAEIDAALSLCQRQSTGCERSWYSDENYRSVSLRPFMLDEHPVTVQEFGEFVAATAYRSASERNGEAYAFVGGELRKVPGENWRNGVRAGSAGPETAVVVVDVNDARAFCKWKKQRLPSEDEWEYAARGPERTTFPWGNEVTLGEQTSQSRPTASSGSPQGIGGRYRGLTGNVWQWTDSTVGDRQVLKGGSWLETNLANRRAAARRLELPTRADTDTGFRCVSSVSKWTDMSIWMRRL